VQYAFEGKWIVTNYVYLIHMSCNVKTDAYMFNTCLLYFCNWENKWPLYDSRTLLHLIITYNLDVISGLKVYRLPRMVSESFSRLRSVRTSGILVQFRTGIKVPNSLRNLSIQHVLHVHLSPICKMIICLSCNDVLTHGNAIPDHNYA